MNLNNTIQPGDPELKFGKEVNSQKVTFDSDAFFWTNEVKPFNTREVKGGGGAKYNMAKAIMAK